jgi:hypothetical protein
MGSGRAGRLFDSYLRIVGALCSIWLLISAISSCWPYAEVLAWHLQHGNFAYFGDYRVPVAAWVSPDPHAPGLQMYLRPRRFEHVTFELRNRVIPGAKWTERWEAISKLPDPCVAALSKTQLAKKSKQVMIADQPSRCIEDMLTIYCVPENEDTGLTVDYFGSKELKPVFYEMLSKVTRVAHK